MHSCPFWGILGRFNGLSCVCVQTLGEFMHTLSEMGFTEDQIQAAVQAGCFSVPEAAEW